MNTLYFKSFKDIVNEAIENIDGNGLYYKFQTNSSFRFKAVALLAEHGYLVHGSTEEFDSFDTSKIKGGMRGNYGYGFYFTNAAYKCEEYGNNFVFVDANSFNFLELEQKVKDNNVVSEITDKIENLENLKYRCEEELYNARNNRDYEYFEGELKKIKTELRQLTPDVSTNVFYIIFNNILKQNPNIDYHNMTKKMSQTFDNELGTSFVPNMFLKLRYDGYHIGTEFVIFNFDKLNANIVKDKNALLERIMGNAE